MLAKISGRLGPNVFYAFFGRLTLANTLAVALGACAGVLATIVIHLMLRRHPILGKTIIAGVFVPTSAILVVIVGHIVLSVFFGGTQGLEVALVALTLISLYVAVFSFLFIVTDLLSARARNLLYSFYGSFLGALFGLVMPTLLLFVVVMVVVAFDLTLFETGLALRFFKAENVKHEKALASISATTPSLEVGLGEFIFYSMIPASIIASYSLALGLIAAGSIVIGALANGRMLSRREMISGLGLPLLPSLVLLGVLLIL